jgi:leucyl-tRNA synthetase
MEYDFLAIEQKWQSYWAKNKSFITTNASEKPKYYILDMFPYPSGAGLHVGHPLGYIASDIVARYKRHKGFNVLHPMGYDSFGLPAEQYAIQTGQHPEVTTKVNIARYREQLDKIGFSFDWEREVRTSDPSYYKWTQWIFIQLFNSWFNPEINKAEPISTLIPKLSGFHDLNEKEQAELLLNYRIAYLSDTVVNWCPKLGTVLANEEVKDGLSERGGFPVEKKLMKQWSLRITAYAERLLNDLDTIDWSESIKEAQRNWIGKSEGSSLFFNLEKYDDQIEVFTTRPDTIFGVSFVALAPEHELVSKITTADHKVAVDEYCQSAKNRSERERMAEVKHISGVFTGAYVLHPFTGKKIPVWIGDYVLSGYGTGAVMAVPAHDSRDFAFAKHFENALIEQTGENPIKIVIKSIEDRHEGNHIEGAAIQTSYDAKDGVCINSNFLNGLEVKEAIKKAIAVIEERGLGKGKINFRLRDAIFGRQRYWGEPIPIYYKDGIACALNEDELPLILPEIDKYLPTENGEPPLARASDKWKKDGKYDYEHSTMPGWAGSSWYFLRYMDVHNHYNFVGKDAVNYWQQIDLYIGGAEHATGHLLYVRFWTKFLYDLGLIPLQEPAKKLINQGMIQGQSSFVYRTGNGNQFVSYNLIKDQFDKISVDELEKLANEPNAKATIVELWKKSSYHKYGKVTPLHVDVNIVDNQVLDIEAFRQWRSEYNNATFVLEEGKYICGTEVEKMSKSKWNVVSPDDMISKYGADCLRLYEMFLGPLELSKPWNTNGITGVSNFMRKLWRLYHQGDQFIVSDAAAEKAELKILHRTIKKITYDIEHFSFNTSVSNFMICVNELTELKCNKREILESLAILISPYAPHIAEELWHRLGYQESITYARYPLCNEEYLVENSFQYPISVNGKTKFTQEFDLAMSKEEIEQAVMQLESVQKLIDGKTPKKVIVVHGKIVNIVI